MINKNKIKLKILTKFWLIRILKKFKEQENISILK